MQQINVLTLCNFFRVYSVSHASYNVDVSGDLKIDRSRTGGRNNGEFLIAYAWRLQKNEFKQKRFLSMILNVNIKPHRVKVCRRSWVDS